MNTSLMYDKVKTIRWLQEHLLWMPYFKLDTNIYLFHIHSLDSKNVGLCSKNVKPLKASKMKSSKEPSKTIQLSCSASAIFIRIFRLLFVSRKSQWNLKSISHNCFIYTWSWYSSFASFYAHKYAYTVPQDRYLNNKLQAFCCLSKFKLHCKIK